MTTRNTQSIVNDLNTHKMRTNKEQAKTIDTFLKFAYNFPLDIHDRFKEYYGESLGAHFYKKFRGHCKKRENTFTAMIYTVGDMSNGNKETFMKMVNDYYNN